MSWGERKVKLAPGCPMVRPEDDHACGRPLYLNGMCCGCWLGLTAADRRFYEIVAGPEPIEAGAERAVHGFEAMLEREALDSSPSDPVPSKHGPLKQATRLARALRHCGSGLVALGRRRAREAWQGPKQG